jgi:ribosomal protein L11 methyltransferase
VAWGIEQFRKKLEEKFGIEIFVQISEKRLENRDWIENFKQSVQPVLIPPFYIHPTWHKPKKELISLAIDPAMAFGSGHHESTELCLGLISEMEVSKKSLLDVGTGSGILGIAGAKLGAEVSICDIDPVAVDSAVENFEKNGLEFVESWIGSAGDTGNSYDIVIANIIPDVIVAISKSLRERSVDKLLLSGILSNRYNLVLENFSDFKLVQKREKNEWVALLLEKRV